MGAVNNKGRKVEEKTGVRNQWRKLIFTRIYPFINILLEIFTNYHQKNHCQEIGWGGTGGSGLCQIILHK